MPTKRRKIGHRRRACSPGLAEWVRTGEAPDAQTYLETPAPLSCSPDDLRAIWESAGRPCEWSMFYEREAKLRLRPEHRPQDWR